MTEHIAQHGASDTVVFFHCGDFVNFFYLVQKDIERSTVFFLLQALIWHWVELIKLANGVEVWYKQKEESEMLLGLDLSNWIKGGVINSDG